MKYFHTPEFKDGMADLYRRGGDYQRAAQEVDQLLGRIFREEEDPFYGMPVTKNGESRINHCVKYRPRRSCRLVTVKHKGVCILLYLGEKKNAEKWLNSHAGLTFGADKQSKLVALSKPSSVVEIAEGAKDIDRVFRGKERLLARLQDKLLDELLDELPGRAAVALSELTVHSRDDDIQKVCLSIPDGEKADTVLDVCIALMEGDSAEALQIIRHYRGEIVPLEQSDELQGSRTIQEIPTDSPEWLELYRHYMKTAHYKDWMLFLHPDQAHIVDKDFAGASKLLGVSGSGKTCVVIKRAVRLAQTYQDQKILILTLNRALAKLIEDLVATAAPPQIAAQIEVKPFFEICQQLIYQFEPGSQKIYSDVTWKSEEHIDAIWREFYRCDLNNNDATVMLPVHDSLIAQGVDAEIYIREEFDWIRSAIAHKQRESYLNLDRDGRSIGLQPQQKKLLLKGLTAWESKMQAIGIIDGLGLVSALQPYLDQIEPAYRSILVDESQDFGTSELDIIRRMVPSGENDLFLCGDAAQQVSSKYQKLAEANVSIPGARSHRIEKNYRNSKEILKAANEVLTRHINEWLWESEEFEILAPEYADFEGSAPLLMMADDLELEIGNAIKFVLEETNENPTWKGCIAFAGYSLYEVQAFGRIHGIRVLDGTCSIQEDALYISDLAQTKGFEFDVVVIVNARKGVLPNPAVPEMEQAKDLAQLYVAMTRAKSQLVLSYHGEISPLLLNMDDEFLQETWSEYLQSDPKLLGVPPSLDELNEDTQIPANIAELDGPQFLYTPHALGQPQLLIEAIRNKVGRSQVSGGEGKGTVGVDMGFVHQMSLDSPSARNRFGREATKQLQELGMRLDLSRLHRQRLADEAG